MHGLDDTSRARLRGLPQVQRLLETAEADVLVARYSRAAVVEALRAALAQARVAIVERGTAPAAPAELLEQAAHLLRAPPALRRVINATGIVLHTNLGRAPLAEEAAQAVSDAAMGYCNLEYDLRTGGRGERLRGVAPLLGAITGAQAGLAVNNNAAAVLLALTGLASGGEVVVSRGELVEIGGGFRIPDIIRQGGARLVEVGTTNKTRLADYENAITADTRMLLKVHQSNFRMVGFTAEATVAELAALARARGLLVMNDLGSGTLIGLGGAGAHEPTVRETLAQGADLVAFSGDKLLGGPQSGLLVGNEAVIGKLRRHPLMRALRLDKLTLAALEATLRLYLDPQRVAWRVPVLRMLGQTAAVLQARAECLAALLEGFDPRVELSQGQAGGGALPGRPIASRAVSVAAPGMPPEELVRRLRAGQPAVAARLADGRVLLDMLAVADSELDAIAHSLQTVRP